MNRNRQFLAQVQARRLFCILFALLIAGPNAKNAASAEPLPSQLTRIAAKLCAKLGLHKEIQVVVADENPRIVSVEKIREPHELFVITFDRQFLNTLDEGEFTAALAHEIGHIWIFSHFPYLHTEALANEIALKSVPRDNLESLYAKLQNQLGDSESMEEFLASHIPPR